MQGGTGQNGPKGGQQAIKMCFATVLDHLEAIGPHLGGSLGPILTYFAYFDHFDPISTHFLHNFGHCGAMLTLFDPL